MKSTDTSTRIADECLEHYGRILGVRPNASYAERLYKFCNESPQKGDLLRGLLARLSDQLGDEPPSKRFKESALASLSKWTNDV